MSTYTFLTINFTEGPTHYYAIQPEKIERLNLSDIYEKYGQRVSKFDAGDYFTITTDSAAAKINEYLQKEEKEDRFAAGDFVSAYSHSDIYSDILDDISFEDGEIEEIKSWVEGFNFWDGHNFQTISTSAQDGEASHSVVTDENLIAELNEAIESKKFVLEGFGTTTYESDRYIIKSSNMQGAWWKFEIAPREDIED